MKTTLLATCLVLIVDASCAALPFGVAKQRRLSPLLNVVVGEETNHVVDEQATMNDKLVIDEISLPEKVVPEEEIKTTTTTQDVVVDEESSNNLILSSRATSRHATSVQDFSGSADEESNKEEERILKKSGSLAPVKPTPQHAPVVMKPTPKGKGKKVSKPTPPHAPVVMKPTPKGKGKKVSKPTPPYSPVTKPKPECVPEGEYVYVIPGALPCCEGTAPIGCGYPIDGECPVYPCVGATICAQCGNGVCGPGENKCNCPGDCFDEPAPHAPVTKPTRPHAPYWYSGKPKGKGKKEAKPIAPYAKPTAPHVLPTAPYSKPTAPYWYAPKPKGKKESPAPGEGKKEGKGKKHSKKEGNGKKGGKGKKKPTPKQAKKHNKPTPHIAPPKPTPQPSCITREGDGCDGDSDFANTAPPDDSGGDTPNPSSSAPAPPTSEPGTLEPPSSGPGTLEASSGPGTLEPSSGPGTLEPSSGPGTLEPSSEPGTLEPSSDRVDECSGFDGAALVSSTVLFEYMIDVDSSYEVDSVVNEIELKMLADVASDVLVCADSIRVRRRLVEDKAVRVSADPKDTVAGSCGGDCHVVEGGMSFEVPIEADVEKVDCVVVDAVRNSLGQIITSVDGLSFIMFIQTDVDCTDVIRTDSDTSDGDGDTDGSDPTTTREQASAQSFPTGGVVGISIGSLFVIALGGLLIFRRRQTAVAAVELKDKDDDDSVGGSTNPTEGIATMNTMNTRSFSPTSSQETRSHGLKVVSPQAMESSTESSMNVTNGSDRILGIVSSPRESWNKPSSIELSSSDEKSIEAQLRHSPSCTSATCQACRPGSGVKIVKISTPKKVFSESSLQCVEFETDQGTKRMSVI